MIRLDAQHMAKLVAAGVRGYRRAQCLRLEEGECRTQSR
jgi:hypothetical protein